MYPFIVELSISAVGCTLVLYFVLNVKKSHMDECSSRIIDEDNQCLRCLNQNIAKVSSESNVKPMELITLSFHRFNLKCICYILTDLLFLTCEEILLWYANISSCLKVTNMPRNSGKLLQKKSSFYFELKPSFVLEI